MLEEEHCSTCNNENEEFYLKLKSEAEDVLFKEPEMAFLVRENILSPDTRSFEEAVAHVLCNRLLISSENDTEKGNHNNGSNFCSLRNPETFFQLTLKCMHSKVIEHGSTMAEAIRADAMAVLERDPATDSLLEVVLFAKGYSALVAHRVAYRLWLMKRKFAALFVQSQTSAGTFRSLGCLLINRYSR
ncbi:MAG: serine O-acetyltransferase [Bacillariaceae sp.]|jgi:serine O-acetyltransferase